jgi:DNA-binding response OmpR family regulator
MKSGEGSEKMALIYIVEDDQNIREIESFALKNSGYQVQGFECAKDFYHQLAEKTPDCILLDIMLPKVNGYELLEYIKPTGTPVIFLTAKAGLDDRVKGLNLGAEDYIVKPFEIVELIARVQVVLRRFHKDATKLVYGDLVINTDNRTVLRDGVPVELTPKEFMLLEIFVRNKNITLFRDKIYELVWENDSYGDTRTLDLHVQRLRKKLGLTDKLKTIYKVGYRLED